MSQAPQFIQRPVSGIRTETEIGEPIFPKSIYVFDAPIYVESLTVISNSVKLGLCKRRCHLVRHFQNNIWACCGFRLLAIELDFRQDSAFRKRKVCDANIPPAPYFVTRSLAKVGEIKERSRLSADNDGSAETFIRRKEIGSKLRSGSSELLKCDENQSIRDKSKQNRRPSGDCTSVLVSESRNASQQDRSRFRVFDPAGGWIVICGLAWILPAVVFAVLKMRR